MLKNFVKLFSGDPTKKTVDQFRGLVEQVNVLEAEYEALSDEEKRLLATGRHCFEDTVMWQYAGLVFGQCLEKCLFKRVFSPLREYVKEKKVDLPKKEEIEVLPKKEEIKKRIFTTTQFFERPDKSLTVVPMVGIFTDVFMEEERLGEKPDHTTYALIWDYLMQLPRRSLIIPKNESSRHNRKAALFFIGNLRNDIAHLNSKLDLSDNISKSWQYLAADEDAFLQYFIGAHLKN